MPEMTLAEYARHRGVSKAAVTYAVQAGRISTTTNHEGKRVIDSEVADQQWKVNTAHEKRRNTADVKAGMGPIAPADPPPAPKGPQQISFDSKTLGVKEEKPNFATDGVDGSFAKARATKEHFLALTAELEFNEAAGKLANVDEIKKEWASIANGVRTKVLGIPSKAKQRIPGLTAEIYLALEIIVRESLEDLSWRGEK